MKRHGSMTKRSRPIVQYVPRRASFHIPDSDSDAGHRRLPSGRGSLTGQGSLSGRGPLTDHGSIADLASQHGSTESFRYTSKETLAVVKKREKTKSCEEMELKLLFASCKISANYHQSRSPFHTHTHTHTHIHVHTHTHTHTRSIRPTS